MNLKPRLCLLAAVAILAGGASTIAAAQELPGRHPYYVHALTDLYAARWRLEHRPGDAAVSGQEDVAITEVDRAIHEARRAAADDGKNVNDHPHEDAVLDHPGRLHRAMDLLRKARADLGPAEDNPETKELRIAVEQHVDAALIATANAIRDVELHR